MKTRVQIVADYLAMNAGNRMNVPIAGIRTPSATVPQAIGKNRPNGQIP